MDNSVSGSVEYQRGADETHTKPYFISNHTISTYSWLLGCTPSVETVSRMAVKWNLPHITYVGTAESLGNKEEFRMLSRLSFTMNVFAKFYMEVFKVSFLLGTLVNGSYLNIDYEVGIR